MPGHARTSPRRRTAMLAAIAIGALSAFAVVAACGAQAPGASTAPVAPVAAAAPAVPAGQYRYALTGTTPTANVNSPVLPASTELNQPVPWTMDSPKLTDLSGLTIADGTLTCSITDSTGKVVVQNTVTGAAGTRAPVMCIPPATAAPAVATPAPTTTAAKATKTTTKPRTATTAKQPSSASDTSYRCTNQIDYSSDPRDNATINSIGAETGKCPTPIKAAAPKSAASDPWIKGQIEWCKEGHDGVPASQC